MKKVAFLLLMLSCHISGFSQCTEAPQFDFWEYVEYSKCGDIYSGSIIPAFNNTNMDQQEVTVGYTLFSLSDVGLTNPLFSDYTPISSNYPYITFANEYIPGDHDGFIIDLVAFNDCGGAGSQRADSIPGYLDAPVWPDSTTCENYIEAPYITGPVSLSRCSELATYTFNSSTYEQLYTYNVVRWQILPQGTYYTATSKNFTLPEIPDSSFTLIVYRYNMCTCNGGNESNRTIFASFDVNVIEDENCGRIAGNVFADSPNNCFNEQQIFPRQKIRINDNYVYSDHTGFYKKYVTIGDYSLELSQDTNVTDCNTNPFEISVLANDLNHTQDLHVSIDKEKITTNIYNRRARVGVRNYGSLTFYPQYTLANTVNASITMPEGLTSILFNIPPTSQSGNTYYWDDISIVPGYTKYILFNYYTDNSIELGDTLCWYGTVEGTAVHDDTHCTIVVNSYDPNEVEVNRETLEESDTDKQLKYTIHFQNTGNDTAYLVTVLDTLDAKLDVSTFKLLNASHRFDFEIDENRAMKWIFPQINLLDSATNEEKSKGWLQFSVDFKDDAVVNDYAESTAHIYFDTNEPITTNTAVTTITNNVSIQEYGAITFSLHPNPATSELFVTSKVSISSYQILSIDGRMVKQGRNISNGQAISVQELPRGIYYLKIADTNGQIAVQPFEKM